MITDERVFEVRWRLAPETFSDEKLLDCFPVINNMRGKQWNSVCDSVSPQMEWNCSRAQGHTGPCLATVGHQHRVPVLEVWWRDE